MVISGTFSTSSAMAVADDNDNNNINIGWGYMILDDDGDGWLCFQISFSGCSKVTEKSLYYLTKVPGLPKLRRVLAHGTGISLAPEFVNVQARFCDTTRKNSPDNKPSK